MKSGRIVAFCAVSLLLCLAIGAGCMRHRNVSPEVLAQAESQLCEYYGDNMTFDGPSEVMANFAA